MVPSDYVAVFRRPCIQTRQYLDIYCINQSESRQGRNEYLIIFFFENLLSHLDSDWLIW